MDTRCIYFVPRFYVYFAICVCQYEHKKTDIKSCVCVRVRYYLLVYMFCQCVFTLVKDGMLIFLHNIMKS